jgi:hypothetical protein
MDIWSREFSGQPECLVEARRFTYAVLGDCDGAHTVALVADELAGNAIKHTASGEPGGEFVLRLAMFGDWCRVRVDDQGGPTAPSVCAADDEDEAGRGLTIVATLSARWGVDGDEKARSVWADIAFGEVAAIPGPDGPAVDLPHQARTKRRVGMTTTDDWNR